jgi:hypothetical protein
MDFKRRHHEESEGRIILVPKPIEWLFTRDGGKDIALHLLETQQSRWQMDHSFASNRKSGIGFEFG